MANKILRIIDRIGEITLSRAELAYQRARELTTVREEHEEVARALLEKKKMEREERVRRLEEEVEIESIEEIDELPIEREELTIPLNERLAALISRPFMGVSSDMMFKNIQEDLYKANIQMPASKYIALSLGISTLVGAISAIVLSILFAKSLGIYWSVVGLVLGFPIFSTTLLLAKLYPKSRVKKRSSEFSRELPFALRHMATQLVSGSGLLETMRSVARSNYGVLSEEFRRAIHEVERGATVEEALERMNLRVDSPGLKKATRQIISTLRTGGNLANTLKIIAEETSREMMSKLKDFIQTLNTFSLMYMFIVVVAPVLITTLVVAMSIATKSLLFSPNLMMILYAAFLFVSVYLSFMVKRFEPKV